MPLWTAKVGLLLEANVGIDVANRLGKTALISAAEHGFLDGLQLGSC